MERRSPSPSAQLYSRGAHRNMWTSEVWGEHCSPMGLEQAHPEEGKQQRPLLPLQLALARIKRFSG